MHEERPAEPLGHLDELGAMGGEALFVLRAQALHAIGDPALAAVGAEELRAALVGKRLLGRIDDLDQVAGGAVGGQRFDVLARLGDGIEEVAEQDGAGVARQMHLRRLRCLSVSAP